MGECGHYLLDGVKIHRKTRKIFGSARGAGRDAEGDFDACESLGHGDLVADKSLTVSSNREPIGVLCVRQSSWIEIDLDLRSFALTAGIDFSPAMVNDLDFDVTHD